MGNKHSKKKPNSKQQPTTNIQHLRPLFQQPIKYEEAFDVPTLLSDKWKNIQVLRLIEQNMGPEDCKHFCRTEWKNLTILVLGQMKIGNKGCLYLTRANWPQITGINLYFCDIGQAGMFHLTKANWRNLKTLTLNVNTIGDEGCNHVSKGAWQKLSFIGLQRNNIGDRMYLALLRCDWKDLINYQLHNLEFQRLTNEMFRSLLAAIRLNYLQSPSFKNTQKA